MGGRGGGITKIRVLPRYNSEMLIYRKNERDGIFRVRGKNARRKSKIFYLKKIKLKLDKLDEFRFTKLTRFRVEHKIR